jgi:tellurite resistance protein TerC
MADLWSWALTPQSLVLIGFHVVLAFILALDLGFFHRHAHAVSMAEAGIWTAVWVVLALIFACGIWNYWHLWHADEPERGPERALEFVTGYLIEKSLSVDNLFVFLLIFRYFSVPAHLQHRVLVWGIVGALIMRAVLILVGAALLSVFHWVIYAFGVFLIYTGYRLARAGEPEFDTGRNRVLRLARWMLPVVENYDSTRFWVRRNGRWHATPLPLVLLVIESSDVMFAVDSIPAIFGVTEDPFIVYTSNVFAILGLRSLYFLLAGFLGMLRYLHVGLAVVLVFIGLKMLGEDALTPYLESLGVMRKHRVLISLGVVAVILSAATAASVWPPKKATTN